MFSIIGVIATILFAIWVIAMIVIECFSWYKDDYSVRYVQNKTWLCRIKECYLIPTVKVHCDAEIRTLDIGIYFLVWELYISYNIRNENES